MYVNLVKILQIENGIKIILFSVTKQKKSTVLSLFQVQKMCFKINKLKKLIFFK